MSNAECRLTSRFRGDGNCRAAILAATVGHAPAAKIATLQQLARLELGRALTAVLDELPDVQLDPAFPAPHARGAMMRTPKELRVRFG